MKVKEIVYNMKEASYKKVAETLIKNLDLKKS